MRRTTAGCSIVATRWEASVARLAAEEKCPRSVVYVAELPREPQGKVRKRELRDAHWVGRATRV